MRTKFIEASNGINWGKFMVAEFTAEEWAARSTMEPGILPLLIGQGWRPDMHRLIVDLATGEGAIFTMGGNAKADLDKHRVWVCPLFEPFLQWLHAQPLEMEALPNMVELPDAAFALRGYRRPGPVTEGQSA